MTEEKPKRGDEEREKNAERPEVADLEITEEDAEDVRGGAPSGWEDGDLKTGYK